MHPSQVLDLKADLMITATNRDWLEMLTTQISMDMLSVKTNGEKPDRKKAKDAAMTVVPRLHDETQSAHAYYVAPDMTDLVEWAADGLDDTDAFRMDEVPTERGFVYFEKPIQMHDIRGKTMMVNAALWFKANFRLSTGDTKTEGYLVLTFNDHRNTPDEIALQMLNGPNGENYAAMGRWGMIGMQAMLEGVRIGPRLISEATYTDGATGETMERTTPFTNIIRVMHAYWLLLDQTVTHVSEAEIPRAFSKRARRMEIPDRVTIVALRRMEGTSHGETDVEWQHRWVVRGHWRWQHVSKDHKLAEPDGKGGWVARVWVRPHVKGPEDKPLHLTEKVYALVR
jgi:hypothetical protein